MSETTEFRIDDRLMENGEEHPGVDPQADIRARIAEKYEQARLNEIREQHQAHGLPPPEIEGFAEEPQARVEATPGPPRAAPAPMAEVQPPQPVQQPVQQAPQLVPMGLPDGRVTYVTPEQYTQLTTYGMATLARTQSAPLPPPPPAAYARPARPRPAFDEERASCYRAAFVVGI